MMETLEIQAFTYEQRHALLPELASACTGCGGWIVERRTISPTHVEFRLEIQLRAGLDLYAALLSAGVELTRAGHVALTELCTRRKHLSLPAELGQTVAIRLEIAFLDSLTLEALLRSAPSRD